MKDHYVTLCVQVPDNMDHATVQSLVLRGALDAFNGAPHAFNINSKVRIKLTPLGVRLWRDERSKQGVTIEPSPEGVLVEQLWVLMNILGPHLFMGGKPLIEGNALHFLIDPAMAVDRGPVSVVGFDRAKLEAEREKMREERDEYRKAWLEAKGVIDAFSQEPPEDFPTEATSQGRSLVKLAEWVQHDWKPPMGEHVLRLAEGVVRIAKESR